MSSLIEDFNYDIFISYRQKDNKYDSWVNEFVDNLKKELEATFKEEINVYFDMNPHDGLLETHDVDASLKEKLKCLIFIPIISRTYCDTKSFAWQHELSAFVEMASKDQYGLRIKLPNGNVSSRVLPIRIYDLNNIDVKLCETILGGMLRGIEFVYAEPGVNRPLKPDDDEKLNLNKTKYRNQINKVSNAIEEIISGLQIKTTENSKQCNEGTPYQLKKNARIKKEKIFVQKPRNFRPLVLLLTFLLIPTIFIFYKALTKNTFEKVRSSGDKISIVVMPFENMTNDTNWNVWQTCIQENLISNLSGSDDLEIRPAEYVNMLLQKNHLRNNFETTSAARSISRKLDATVLVFGNIQQAGDRLRLNAKLIDTKKGEILKSIEVDGQNSEESILDLTDTLRKQVTDFLIISKLKKQNREFQDLTFSHSPEAYKSYVLGKEAYYRMDYTAALNWLNQALAIDSNFTWPMRFIVSSYNQIGNLGKAKDVCIKWCEKRNNMSIEEKLWASYEYSHYFETPIESIRYLNQLKELNDQNPAIYFSLGLSYHQLEQFENAIPEYEQALSIYDKWGSKPMWSLNYTNLGYAYHRTHQYKKEEKLYKKANEDFPNNFYLRRNQIRLALAKGDTMAANKQIERLSDNDAISLNISEISLNLAFMYEDERMLRKAEEYYRKALSMGPTDKYNIYYLAYFLIDKDINIGEGLVLIENALQFNLDSTDYLSVKGWGLYKQGKINEAKKALQRSWDKRLSYDHNLYLHLQAVNKN